MVRTEKGSVTGRLRLLLCLLAAVCGVTFVFGMGLLYVCRDASVQAATYGEKKSLSLRIDPARDSESNVVSSEEYGALGRILTSDGMLLYSPTETAGRAFYNLIGDPTLDSGLYVASTQRELLTSPPVSLWHGLRHASGTLTLTLNGGRQERLFQFMQDRGVTGVGAQYNVRTGEVTAMVSTPGVCPWETDRPEGSLTNVCLSTVSPGSTMKLVTLLLAARQGIDLNALSFRCDGCYLLENGDSVDCTNIHGEQTVTAALGNSCNCFFAQLIRRLDLGQARDDLKTLGFTVNGEPGKARQAGGGDALDSLNRRASSVQLNDCWDFSSIWSLIGEGSAMVNPLDLLYFAGSISEGAPVPYPHLTVGTPAVAEPLFPEEAENETAAVVRDIWQSAYDSCYGAAYSDRITVAKTGTGQTDSGGEMKRLVGRSGDEMFFVTVENYIQNGRKLDVLPVDIANFLVDG